MWICNREDFTRVKEVQSTAKEYLRTRLHYSTPKHVSVINTYQRLTWSSQNFHINFKQNFKNYTATALLNFLSFSKTSTKWCSLVWNWFILSLRAENRPKLQNSKLHSSYKTNKGYSISKKFWEPATRLISNKIPKGKSDYTSIGKIINGSIGTHTSTTCNMEEQLRSRVH